MTQIKTKASIHIYPTIHICPYKKAGQYGIITLHCSPYQAPELPNSKMYKILSLLVLVAALCVITEAQLTFTSSWGGKRAGGTMSCKNEEAVANIFKLIQNEAERFIICQKA
ncbi:adipokinetic prohormone type 1-like [Trichoplusia ni]|uniref:Adipokinetic prohormone type 1-like n=1 Tax=Trichoplusia ni TaxID=7111 RepID=A0A7E5VTP9_TRINI|nr:adipokinetic prohormone type 1-like [Trichoplusia ni]